MKTAMSIFAAVQSRRDTRNRVIPSNATPKVAWHWNGETFRTLCDAKAERRTSFHGKHLPIRLVRMDNVVATL